MPPEFIVTAILDSFTVKAEDEDEAADKAYDEVVKQFGAEIARVIVLTDAEELTDSVPRF